MCGVRVWCGGVRVGCVWCEGVICVVCVVWCV